MIKLTMLEEHEGARAGDDVVFMDDALAQWLVDNGKAKPFEPKAEDGESMTLTTADVGVLKL